MLYKIPAKKITFELVQGIMPFYKKLVISVVWFQVIFSNLSNLK